MIQALRRGYPLLVAALLLFNLFAVPRAFPVNSSLKMNEAQPWGDYDRAVYRVMKMAKEHADLPFSEVNGHAVFHGRNPGLFLFVVEMGLRAGIQSPFPMQLVSVLMFNLGLVCFFFWVKNLSGSGVVAGLAALFLSTSNYPIVSSSSLHAHPYHFMFFNLAMLCMCLFFDGVRRRLTLSLAWVSYFVVCSNYWMYYIPTFLMILGISYVKGQKLFQRANLIVFTAPVAALTVFLASAISYHGGIEKTYRPIAEILVARTVDARLAGGHWYPHKRFMDGDAWLNYPWTVSERVATSFYISGAAFLFMAIAAYFMLRGRHGSKIILFAVPAGLSWNVLMVQHTFIHAFTGMYGFYAWALAFAYFFVGVWETYKEAPRRRIAGVGAVVAVLAVIFLWAPAMRVKYIKGVTIFFGNLL